MQSTSQDIRQSRRKRDATYFILGILVGCIFWALVIQYNKSQIPGGPHALPLNGDAWLDQLPFITGQFVDQAERLASKAGSPVARGYIQDRITDLERMRTRYPSHIKMIEECIESLRAYVAQSEASS